MKVLQRITAAFMAVCLAVVLGACSEGNEWEEFSTYSVIPGSGDEGQALTSGTTTTVKKKVTKTKKENEGLLNSDTLTPQEELFAKSNLKGTTFTYVKGAEGSTSAQEQYAIDMLTDKWGVNVKYVVYSSSAFTSMVPTLVASGNPPDVGLVADTNMVRFVYANLATPIDDYLVKNDPVWDTAETFQAFTFGGKIYGVAKGDAMSHQHLIWYNKTYMKEVGAEDPYTLYQQGKWNTAKFLDVAKQATTFETDGRTVKTYGVATFSYNVFLAMFGETAVTELSNGKWQVTIDSAAGMQGLQLLYDLYAANAVKIAGGMQAAFGSRNSAMLIERNKNAIGNYDYYNTMDDEIGMVPLPASPDGKYYAFTNTDGAFVLKGAKNPAAAVAYRYYERLMTLHASDEEKRAAGYSVDESVSMSDEHRAIAEDYLKNKCTATLDSKLTALSNWTTGENLSAQFWNQLIEGRQPAQLVDSMKAQINRCLKDTVGVANVIG